MTTQLNLFKDNAMTNRISQDEINAILWRACDAVTTFLGKG
jgi:hypothetical protein